MLYFVAGLGRCGTSLVMQMLHAGGAPVLPVDPPAFEDVKLYSHLTKAPTLIDGKFVKVLDAHRWMMPVGPAKVIWCKREYKDQAQSQYKFLTQVALPSSGMSAVPGGTKRSIVRSYESQLPADTLACFQKFQRLKYNVLTINFETLLVTPYYVVDQIKDFLMMDFQLDAEKMKACVIFRDKKCRPDMTIESNLISKYEQRRAK